MQKLKQGADRRLRSIAVRDTRFKRKLRELLDIGELLLLLLLLLLFSLAGQLKKEYRSGKLYKITIETKPF